MTIMLQDSAESLRADDSFADAVRLTGRSRQKRGRCPILDEAVLGWHIVRIRQASVQMSLAEDAEVIETFGFDAEDEAFGVSVLIRLSRCGRLDADPLFFQDGIELGNEFAVTVADQLRRLKGQRARSAPETALAWSIIHARSGLAVKSADVNAAGADVDEEQDVIGLQSRQRPDLLGEEVAGKQGIGMALDELFPGRFAAIGSRVDAMFAQDVGDRRPRDLIESELLEFAVDARVAPAVFAGQSQDQVANFLVGSRPARLLGVRLGVGIGGSSSEEGARRDDADESQMALPRGLAEAKQASPPSLAVTRMRRGSFLRRMSFSTFKYWTCWANSLSLNR